jgi:hypothetical protein
MTMWDWIWWIWIGLGCAWGLAVWIWGGPPGEPPSRMTLVVYGGRRALHARTTPRPLSEVTANLISQAVLVLIMIGMIHVATLFVHPYLALAIGLIFWLSWALSLLACQHRGPRR